MRKNITKSFLVIIKQLLLPTEENGYRSRFLQSNAFLFCLVLLLVLKIFSIVIFINFPSNIFFADITKVVLENFVNQTRTSLGLKPLVENEKLNEVALLKARDMIEKQYFSHTSPTGTSPWFWFLKAGYNYQYAGENLAVGFFESEEVFKSWLNSPSHKENIINPRYTEIGTAVLKGFGPNNAIVVVQVFGAPKPTHIVTQKTSQESIPPTTPTATTSLEKNIDKNEEEIPITTAGETKILSQSIGDFPENYKKSFIPPYYYGVVAQRISYGLAVLISGILFFLIIMSRKNKIVFKRALVNRIILIIILLSATILIEKEAVLALIPQEITI